MRERFDPAARRGLGAHITILYPFAAPEAVGVESLQRLAAALAGIGPFRFALTRLARFPGTIYLAPKPASRFIRLHASLAGAFVDADAQARTPFVPHLSVARDGQGDADGVEAELLAQLRLHGPIECLCRELAWMENGSGLWRMIRTLQLGRGGAP
ncbi:MAG: 2'-5' RNA ligase family protein [Gammaproteobacteria bacterium]|nr:2'-5' RNA ligase family protein [Gammaproteobacteria bacterium]